jgi:hypothetical protein
MTSVRDRLFLYLFTTALEGGIGYWSAASSYHWQNPDGSDDVLGFYADIESNDDDFEPVRINRGVIQRGYNLAATEWGTKLCWSTEPPPLVITADTDWDFDAGDADMIVQLGLFGDVVYG